MLINPNLTEKSEFNKNSIVIYNNSLDINFIDENTIKIKKKKEAEFGLIYVNLFSEFAIGSKLAFSGKIELMKGQNVRIYFNGFEVDPILVSKTGVKRIEAIGMKNSSWNQAQVRVYHDDEVVFRFTEMKLEKDEVTPYIPNENSIQTAKRQYFIGGGVRSKRCIQSRYTGGALC